MILYQVRTIHLGCTMSGSRLPKTMLSDHRDVVWIPRHSRDIPAYSSGRKRLGNTSAALKCCVPHLCSAAIPVLLTWYRPSMVLKKNCYIYIYIYIYIWMSQKNVLIDCLILYSSHQIQYRHYWTQTTNTICQTFYLNRNRHLRGLHCCLHAVHSGRARCPVS